MTVSKTTNSGSSWTRYYLNSSGFTYALAVDPQNSNIVYAGGNPTIYKTMNGGTNWSECSAGLSRNVSVLTIHPENTNIIFAGTPAGVFKSTNAGTNWSYVGLDSVRSIVIDCTTPDTVFAGTNTGVFISQDLGTTWTGMNDGLADTTISCLGVLHGQYLYAATAQAGMYRYLLGPGIEEKSSVLCHPDLVVFPTHGRGDFRITCHMSCAGKASLAIFDIQGRCVRTLIDDHRVAGTYNIYWDVTDAWQHRLPAGVYFCRLGNAEKSCVRKLVIVK